MGGTALVGLPLQLIAGSLSDRLGRRAVMILCAACSTIMYGGLAFVHGLWPACLLVFCDRALGWPMFLTASNTMVADLVRPRLRPEGYSLVRLMIGAGEVVGPLVAAGLLAARCPLPVLFALAGAGCFGFLVFTLAALKETRPAHAARSESSAYETGVTQALGSAVPTPARQSRRRRRRAGDGPGTGYGRVLADRRFLAFCAISLLPLFIFGQMYASFPVLVTGTLHVQQSTWGLLMSFMAVIVVLTQYPAIRLVKRLDPMFQIALASALFGLGVGLTAFVPAGALLMLTMATLALAQALFGPVSSSIVAGMADVEVRGRYMGAWTLIWSAGQQAIGPMLGGVLFDRLGAHGTYGLIIAVGLTGACLYPLLRRGRLPVATPVGESPSA
jgi:MFS family permease